MYKYLLLISASAVPGAAYAQTASEQALEEIIAAQDEANEAGDQQATVGSYRSSAPAEAEACATNPNSHSTVGDQLQCEREALSPPS